MKEMTAKELLELEKKLGSEQNSIIKHAIESGKGDEKKNGNDTKVH